MPKGAVDSHDSLPFLAVGAASTEANPDFTSCPVYSKCRNIFNPMCEDEYIEYESPWVPFSPNFLSSIARWAIFKLLLVFLEMRLESQCSRLIQVTGVRYHTIESLDTLYISRVVAEE
jgi:hypothetical protein